MNSITHYMGLIMGNQPWNLLFFMAIPVIFAEMLTITEFSVLFNRKRNKVVQSEVTPLHEGIHLTSTINKINKFVGIVGGIYFTGIFVYVLTTVAIPLTVRGEWNTWVDVIAIVFYLSRILFLLPISLMELGLIFKKKSKEEKISIHFKLIVGFLIVAHINMIFGMLSPDVIRGMAAM